MAVVFWDRKDVLMVEFMQQGTTITCIAKHTEKEKLHTALQNKRHGMLTFGVVLLHGSVCLHTAART
jgi:hypothetical protein